MTAEVGAVYKTNGDYYIFCVKIFPNGRWYGLQVKKGILKTEGVVEVADLYGGTGWIYEAGGRLRDYSNVDPNSIPKMVNELMIEPVKLEPVKDLWDITL